MMIAIDAKNIYIAELKNFVNKKTHFFIIFNSIRLKKKKNSTWCPIREEFISILL